MSGEENKTGRVFKTKTVKKGKAKRRRRRSSAASPRSEL